MTTNATPQRKVALYLVLTTLLGLPSYLRIIGAGSLGVDGGMWVLALMWAPGVAGILTRLITQRSLRGMGWGAGRPGYLGFAYLLPIVACLIVYPLVWLTGAGGMEPERVQAAAAGIGAGDLSFPLALLVVGTLGVAMAMISATGEEIGWRGLLVPELAKFTDPTRTALVSGAIWFVYHVPLILLADYSSGAPALYTTAMFAAMVMALSFVLTWVRLGSGSLWGAAIFHASHNLFVQGVFDRMTTDLGPTEYITTEFGFGLAAVYAVVAWLLWRRTYHGTAQ